MKSRFFLISDITDRKNTENVRMNLPCTIPALRGRGILIES